MTTSIPIDPNAVYSDRSVAALLGVTIDALREAEKTGQLRHRRVGRRVLYLGSSLIEWLRARPIQGTTKAVMQ
jgi:Helix-turn-helix domain